MLIREIELRYKTHRAPGGRVIDSPGKVWEIMLPYIANETVEHFFTICLDSKNSYLGHRETSRGTVTEAIVHPREVFLPAIACGATAIVCAHNHPSGAVAASGQDINTTRRLAEAGKIIGIPIIDHIILTNDTYFSFKEGGYI